MKSLLLSTALALAAVSLAFAVEPASEATKAAAKTEKAASSCCASGCQTQQKVTEFGEPVAGDVQEVTLAQVLAEPQAYHGKLLKVTGTVSQVCSHSGCWLEMTTAEKPTTLVVKFTCPIEGRLIPMEAVGKTATVAGTLTVEEIDEETARHYAAEGGKTPEQVAAIVGPQTQVRLDGPWAQVRGL